MSRCFAARTLWVFTALVLASCFGDGTGPGDLRRARILIEPNFDNRALLVVDVNRVLIRFTRPGTSTIVKEEIFDFPATTDTLDLSIELQIEGSSQQFDLTLLLIDDPAGDTLFRAGPTLITATASSVPTTLPTAVPLYVGPGANATGIRFIASAPSVFLGQTAQFTAEAFDVNNVVVPTAPITYSSSNQALAAIDAATGLVTAGNVRGSVQVSAELPRTSATTAAPLVSRPLVIQPTASSVVVLSGGGQTGPVGGALSQPVTVRVNATDNLGVQGVTVNFAVLSGGTLSAPSGVSDANGDVSITWTLGSLLGGQSMSATVPGVAGATVNVPATAIVGPPTQLVYITPPSSGTTGIALIPPVSVGARDAFGNPTPSFTGLVSLAIGANPGGASLTGGGPVNAGAGVATFSAVQLSAPGTGYTLVASSASLTSATSAAFAIQNPIPTQLAFVQQPTTTTALGTIAPAVQVAIRDAGGSTVTSATNTVTIAIGSGPTGAALTGTLSAAAVSGIATFGNLVIDLAGTGYTLSATATGLTGATSASFDVSPLPTSWNAATDFSNTLNPNGQWSSGWTATLGSSFSLYGFMTPGSGLEPWRVAPAQPTPTFQKNVSAGTVTGIPPGAVSLHPGCGALEYSELRWTAPIAGNYLANAQFFAGDVGNTDAAVMVNGAAPVFAAALTGASPSYSTFLALAAGDRIQFAVGAGGDGCFNDNTPVAVTILATGTVTLSANSAVSQGGTAGIAVGSPPSVVVRDGASNPIAGVTVTFQVTAGGGLLTGATQITNASGVATVGSWTLGATPGANAVSAGVPGATPVVFSAAGAAAGPPTWTGAVSSVWTAAGNWQGGAAPAVGEDVVIPAGTPNPPVLDVNPVIGSLQVAAGATLSLVNHALTVRGNLDVLGAVSATTGFITLAQTAPATIRGSLPTLTTGNGNVLNANGPVTITGSVLWSGASADLRLNGNPVSVSGNMTVNGGAKVTLTNAADLLIVQGNATFDGGDQTGLFTAGEIAVGGNFSQVSTSTPNSFVATGTRLRLTNTGAGQFYQFASSGPASSRLSALHVTGAGDVAQNGFVYVTDSVVVASPVQVGLLGASLTVGRKLISVTGSTVRLGSLTINADSLQVAGTYAVSSTQFNGGADASGMTFDNTRVVIGDGAPLTAFDNITFMNMNTAATQLDISRSTGTFTFNSHFYVTTPVTGLYLSLNGPLGVTLTMVGASPGTCTLLCSAVGGAMLNWP